MAYLLEEEDRARFMCPISPLYSPSSSPLTPPLQILVILGAMEDNPLF